MSSETSAVLASDDVGTLTIERIFAPAALANLVAESTSAVSPLCEIAITTVSLSIESRSYLNSLAITGSNRFFITRAPNIDVISDV